MARRSIFSSRGLLKAIEFAAPRSQAFTTPRPLDTPSSKTVFVRALASAGAPSCGSAPWRSPDKTSAASVLAPGVVASATDVPRERQKFRALIVANPNYFGNLADSPDAPALGIKGNND